MGSISPCFLPLTLLNFYLSFLYERSFELCQFWNENSCLESRLERCFCLTSLIPRHIMGQKPRWNCILIFYAETISQKSIFISFTLSKVKTGNKSGFYNHSNSTLKRLCSPLWYIYVHSSTLYPVCYLSLAQQVTWNPLVTSHCATKIRFRYRFQVSV